MFRWLLGNRLNQATEVEEANTDPNEGGFAAVEPQRLPVSGEIVTDTASVAVFDLAALVHRVDDECDWWADPGDELKELRARNLLIVGLGSDGIYEVEVTDTQVENASVFSLLAPSGIIFVGAGEGLSGGGYQPNGSGSGYLISVDAGEYSVSVGRVGDVLQVGLVRGEAFENEAVEPFTL